MMDAWNRNRLLRADAAFERDEADADGKRLREREALRKQKLDDALDRALEDSFPGSDPASVTQPPASPFDRPRR